MGNQADLIVRKRNSWVTAIKVILVLAAIAFVAYKIYDKFAKKNRVLPAVDGDADALCAGADADEDVSIAAEETAYEVAAEDVIINSEEMAEA